MMVKRNPDIEYYKTNYEKWKKEAKKFIQDIKNESSFLCLLSFYHSSIAGGFPLRLKGFSISFHWSGLCD